MLDDRMCIISIIATNNTKYFVMVIDCSIYHVNKEFH